MYKDLCTTKASVFLGMIISCRAKNKLNLKSNIYIIKQDIYPIAGQTVGPIGLIFFG